MIDGEYMTASKAYEEYKKTQIETASQGKLVLMLYDGVIKFCHQAIDAIKTKKYDKANNAIIRAEDIITELLLALDYDKGKDIAKKLASIYVYLNQQLLEANITKTIEPIELVIKLMGELRESWEKILQKFPGQSEPSQNGGLNISG